MFSTGCCIQGCRSRLVWFLLLSCGLLLSVLFSGFVLVILVVLRLSVLLSGSVLVILVVLRLSVLLSGSVLVILLVPVFWFLLSVLRVVLLEMAEGLGLEEVEEGIEDVERDYMAGN